jgi:hypothetical protein
MALRGRLARLERDSSKPSDCPVRCTVILSWHPGEPRPTVPPDAHRCDRCGAVHPLILREVVVGPGDPVAVDEVEEDELP